MAGTTKGFPPSYTPLAPMAPTILPLAYQAPDAEGNAPDTTRLFNPQWDEWLNQVAQTEGQSPDEHGVTHLTLGSKDAPVPADAPHATYDPSLSGGEYVTPSLLALRKLMHGNTFGNPHG